MLAIVYFIISAVFGICLVNLTVSDPRRLFVACAPNKKAIESIPNTLFTVPSGILVGLIVTGFFNYFVILGLSYFVSDGNLCKRIGVLITFAIMIWLILSILIIINRRRLKREEEGEEPEIAPYEYRIRDTLFYGITAAVITAIATFLMTYTYRISGDELMAGFSTFSDLAPHTAMVSSFSNGFNFPTQYMHFSGDGIQYHFMFYFFCGMMNYGGLPIDMAINLPSIVTMVCALVLLGLLAMLLSGKKLAFAIAPLLVFFRSSWNAFDHLLLLMKEKSFVEAVQDILNFESWYEVTPYDSWGIWAINVYPNQRHLMLGVGLTVMMIILFTPYVRRMCISMIRAGSFGGAIKAFLFSGSSWLPRKEDSLNPYLLTILACITVIVMPFFHGSALIALLLVLLGMAIFSECRLLYLITAVCAVVSSYIQTRVFSGNVTNVVKFKWAPGFIVENPTVANVALYILIVTGLTLILGLLVAVIILVKDIAAKHPIYRFLMFLSFLFPMVFAFLIQVSLEMLANHKFIQITLILVDAFVAILMANLFALPLKIRAKGAGAEVVLTEVGSISGPAAETSESSETSESGDPVVFNGELISGEVANLADSDSGDGDGELDLPEEIVDLPDEIEDLPEELAEEPVEDLPEDLDDEAEIIIKEVTEIGEAETKDIHDDKSLPILPMPKIAEISETQIIDDEEGGEAEDDESDAEEDGVADNEDNEDDFEDENKVADRPDIDDEDDDDSDNRSLPAVREEALSLTEKVGEEDEAEEASEASEADETTETSESSEEPESESESESEPSVAAASAEPAPEAPAARKGAKEVSLGKFIALQLAAWLLALALLVPLTATGVSEWCTYINLNSDHIYLNPNSSMTKWIIENTDTSDVFLTPMWSLEDFYLAGRASYYGWPYYAWSAGHDTEKRDQIYAWLITGCNEDIDEFTRYCKERGIKYLIASPDFNAGTYAFDAHFDWDFFSRNLTQVAAFNENGCKIYKIY
ncbi:hypothetical protein SAMN02910456_02248 [Ruminococcaceae bacterium YRB3002]|nr:hypothetical protein SAMN02910456_02248 [Ruminococcaceae bacterium YRB3002]